MAPMRCKVPNSTTIASTFWWIRPKTRTRQVLLLVAVIYASAVFFWSAHRISAFTSRLDHSSIDQSGKLQNLKMKASSLLNGNETEKINSEVSNNYPFGETRLRNLQCIGWRTTHECSPEGERWSAFDQNCSQIVSKGESGYCEVVDVDSGEKFRVMRRHCNSLRKGALFRCKDAPKFVNFRVQAENTMRAALKPGFMLPHVNATAEAMCDGIVMVVYPKLFASAYATIRLLRNVLKCQLPIEIWFRPDEINAHDKSLEPLKHLAATEGNITFQKIHDPRAKRFVAKIHAIYHSKFDRVLFLDADNVPVRDPSFLFESTEFMKTGAIFWPDFWHPDHSIFSIHENSLLWELLDMPFVDMFEQESGQLLVDRRRHAAPLMLVRFYALHRPNFFSSLKLAWGDKDLFRFAWLKLNIPFTMIQTPPGMAGIVSDGFLRSDFCGMTMVQHDADGEILFMHRNQHKLTGKFADPVEDASLQEKTLGAVDDASDIAEKYADPIIWTHILQFHMKSSRRHYAIQMFWIDLAVIGKQKCYGQRDVYRNPHFYVQETDALNVSRLESQLRHFALDSVQFLSKTPNV